MGWVNDALVELNANRSVTVQPFGGSMRGRIESGQLVTLEPVTPSEVAVDDAVLVKWHGNYLLHLVKEIRDDQFLIGNNIGKINGWVPREAVIGKVAAVRDEPILIGTVVEAIPNIRIRVQLESGEIVETQIPKRIAHDLLVVSPGDRLRIGGAWNQQFRVIGRELTD